MPARFPAEVAIRGSWGIFTSAGVRVERSEIRDQRTTELAGGESKRECEHHALSPLGAVL